MLGRGEIELLPEKLPACRDFMFIHPDHGKVWAADCHTNQVADTMKWEDAIMVLGASHPL